MERVIQIIRVGLGAYSLALVFFAAASAEEPAIRCMPAWNLPEEVPIPTEPFEYRCTLANPEGRPWVVQSIRSLEASKCTVPESSSWRAPTRSKEIAFSLRCSSKDAGKFVASLRAQVFDSIEKKSVFREGRVEATVTTEIIEDADRRHRSPKDCPDVRLDHPGGSMEDVLPLTQMTGSCAFHTAAAQYDAWRFSRDLDAYQAPQSGRLRDSFDSRKAVFTPRTHAAFQYKQSLIKGTAADPASSFDGAESLDPVLRVLLESPPCGRVVGWDTATLEDGTIYEKPEAYIMKLREAIRERGRGKSAVDSSQINCVVDCGKAWGMGAPVELLPYSSLDSLLQVGNEIAFTEKAFPALNQACSGALSLRLKKAHPEVFTLSTGLSAAVQTRFASLGQKRLVHAIHRAFDADGKRAQPVGIGYCSLAVMSGLKRVQLALVESDPCGSHASLVIGRRFNAQKKRCEFLVRNTWGASGREIYRNGVVPEGKHHFWIGQDELAASLMALSYYRK